MGRPQSKHEGRSNRPSRDMAHGAHFSRNDIVGYILNNAKSPLGPSMTPEAIGRWVERKGEHARAWKAYQRGELTAPELLSRLPKQGVSFHTEIVAELDTPEAQPTAHIRAWEEHNKAEHEKAERVKTLDGLNVSTKSRATLAFTAIDIKPPKRFFGGAGKPPSKSATILDLMERFKAGKITAEKLAAELAKLS